MHIEYDSDSSSDGREIGFSRTFVLSKAVELYQQRPSTCRQHGLLSERIARHSGVQVPCNFHQGGQTDRGAHTQLCQCPQCLHITVTEFPEGDSSYWQSSRSVLSRQLDTGQDHGSSPMVMCTASGISLYISVHVRVHACWGACLRMYVEGECT